MQQFAELLPVRRESTLIRLMHAKDLDAFHACRSDEHLARFQGWSAMSRDQALNFIVEMSQAKSLIPGGWVQLSIAEAQTDGPIGDLGLFLDSEIKEAEIGFTLGRAAHGAGHATRAVLASIELIFRTTPVEQIRAVTDARNASSVRVLQRAGFSRIAEQQAFFKGECCTELVYAFRRSDA